VRDIPSLTVIRAFFFIFGLLSFFILERIFPSREDTASNLPRWFANIALSVINAVVVGLIAGTILTATLSIAKGKNFGLLATLPLSPWIKIFLGVVFLDFLLYIWHLVNHVVPFFWRFHQVHHSDLDLDVTTASRFHFGEIAMAMLIRSQLILILGPEILVFIIFDTLVVLTSQFHHSKIRLPIWLEKIYWVFFVPPKMHLIHHSTIPEELNSNYGTIFSFWDRLFGTLTVTPRLEKVEIGLNVYRSKEDVSFSKILVMPFRRNLPIRPFERD